MLTVSTWLVQRTKRPEKETLPVRKIFIVLLPKLKKQHSMLSMRARIAHEELLRLARCRYSTRQKTTRTRKRLRIAASQTQGFPRLLSHKFKTFFRQCGANRPSPLQESNLPSRMCL